MDIMERIFNLKREHYREYGMHQAYVPDTIILGRNEYFELKRHKDFHSHCSLLEITGRKHDMVMGMDLIEAADESCLRLGHMLEGGED